MREERFSCQCKGNNEHCIYCGGSGVLVRQIEEWDDKARRMSRIGLLYSGTIHRDKTFVDAQTIASRAFAALQRPNKSDYRTIGGAGKRPKDIRKRVVRVAADGKIRSIRLCALS